MFKEVYKTACGGRINITPRVQGHLTAHPDVISHLPEAISRIHLPSLDKKFETEVQMDFVVGRAGVVKTDAIRLADSSLFATRTNRPFPSRVAEPGSIGAESTTVVIIAKPIAAKTHYELITAWIGVLAKKEPWDPSITSQEEFNECLRYWCTSALVLDSAGMGPVRNSSWQEVLTQAGSRFF